MRISCMKFLSHCRLMIQYFFCVSSGDCGFCGNSLQWEAICEKWCCSCKLVLCLHAGADSDWHHLEPVTCREGHAQRVERGWGVKGHHAPHPINPTVVQMNDEYLRVQTVKSCLFQHVSLFNKLNVILLIHLTFIILFYFFSVYKSFVYHSIWLLLSWKMYILLQNLTKK